MGPWRNWSLETSAAQHCISTLLQCVVVEHSCQNSCFPRMRSKGSGFTLGVWGLRVCVRSTLRLRPQLPATVRNRPREVAMAVPMASFATVVTFGGFKRRVASCCVADVAFCDIPTCFITREKSFCVAGAILLHRFQKMSCSSPARRSTLATSIVISHGRRTTLDVSRCVSFTNRAEVATRCKSRGRRSILWDVLKIDGSLGRNIDFEVANLEVQKGIGRKTSILKLHSQCEIWRKSPTKCSFWGCNMSSLDSLVFFCSRRVYGGSCKTSPFRRSRSRLECFVLRGRRGTSWHSHVSAVGSRFAWQRAGAALWRSPSSFGVPGAVVLRVCCESHCQGCVEWWQCANSVAGVGHCETVILRGTTCSIWWRSVVCRRSISHTLYSIHSTLHLHFTLHTLHSTLYTPHCALYTPHSTLSTIHCTFHTLHSTH